MLSNPFALDEKVIIITGASSGIGRGCAISCSKAGAKVFLVGRNEDTLKETLLLMFGTGHQYAVCDITNYEFIEGVVSDAVVKLGKIDGFIHSAGFELTKPINVMKPADYEYLNAVNIISALEFVKHISKKKYLSDSGASVVFISSVMGMFGEIAHAGYCASKGAVLAAVKALALELANKQIRVNSVSPGQIKGTHMTTRMLENFSEENKKEKLAMHPLGYGEVEDVASACIYLLSRASKWVTGTNLIVDGGYSAK